MLIESRNSVTGEYCCTDMSQYSKVLSAKRQLGQIPSSQERADLRKMSEHPLLGKVFQMGDERYEIVSVHSYWYGGFYEQAVVRIGNTNSHGVRYIKNNSCCFEPIAEAVAEFEEKAIFL